MLRKVALALIALSAIALGHDPGLSSANVTVSEATISVDLFFAPADLESLSPPEAAELVTQAVEWSQGGKEISPANSQFQRNGTDYLHFALTYPRSDTVQAVFSSKLLPRFPSGHRQLLSVRKPDGTLLISKLLTTANFTAEIPLGALPQVADERPGSLVGFVHLGIEHILTGYDHLLFLCALLLVCERFSMAVRLITSFTLAHSITLALATFNVVSLPGHIVEPLIAASIIYIGIENLLARGQLQWRVLLTFCFGLIHGLGFASVLRDLGIGEDGRTAVGPLLCFNLGVEIGQVAIAALVLPLMMQLRSHPGFLHRGIPALSSLVVIAGGYWLIERTTTGF